MSAELRDKQDEREDFFDNGAVPLHVVSGEGVILRANQAELDILGYGRDEYRGQPIADIHADDEAISEIRACLRRGGKIERFPARLRAKDGSTTGLQRKAKSPIVWRRINRLQHGETHAAHR